jgi:hypothetical protein
MNDRKKLANHIAYGMLFLIPGVALMVTAPNLWVLGLAFVLFVVGAGTLIGVASKLDPTEVDLE